MNTGHLAPALFLLLTVTLLPAAEPPGEDFAAELLNIQTAWAQATYHMSTADKAAALERLSEQAATFNRRHPDRAEALIWEGIVLSSRAGASGGLTGLSLARQARDRLEAALALDPSALDGSAHTSLGTLYHRVPGWPIGFGSDRKAREHFEQALAINPEGIDPNYFYAEFLYDNGRLAEARRHLQKALAAPSRPNRAVADEGRRAEARELLRYTGSDGPSGPES